MSDATTLQPAEGTVIERPDVRLVLAERPAGPVIEALLTALSQGKVSPKLGREMLVRLVPPAKATVKVKLPRIVDATSYAAAARKILAAAAAGRISPGDAATMMRVARGTHEAVRVATGSRLAFGR